VLSERDICDRLYAILGEGQRARFLGQSNPYPANTLFSMMHSIGWLQEDLRRGLMRSDQKYREEQERFEREGVYGSKYTLAE